MNLPTVSRMLAIDPFEMFDSEAGRGVTYGVDVREDADKLIVEAELPGFRKNEVEIVLDKSVLTITAAHVAPQPTNGGNIQAGDSQPAEVGGEWLLRERRRGTYRRAFHLPRTADGANVAAMLEDGILTITLTKREETKPRRIAVS